MTVVSQGIISAGEERILTVAAAMLSDAYRGLAIDRAKAAVAALAKLGVRALVTGSLARGGFSAHSDVDLLVTDCLRRLKYAIEGIVEDSLGGIPFDVIYLEELPPWRVARFTEGAIDASELG